MSRRLTRPLLALLLLAPYGAVASLGAGLHALPGCGHRAAARPAGGGDGGGVGASGWQSPTAHGCAICDQLAQGQLAAGQPAGPAGRLHRNLCPE